MKEEEGGEVALCWSWWSWWSPSLDALLAQCSLGWPGPMMVVCCRHCDCLVACEVEMVVAVCGSSRLSLVVASATHVGHVEGCCSVC
jgi:hypothetical protein